jgi:hypothetical protein
LGADAEVRVGAQLDSLRDVGFAVEHDVRKKGRGNVDHVVHAGSVTFLIDTKRSTWRGADLGQARRHAEWASSHYGSRRVFVSVICVQRSQKPPHVVENVHIVSGSDIRSFVMSRG